MKRRTAALALALCLLAPPAGALAQSPFSPLPPAQQPTDTAPVSNTSNTTSDDGGGLKTWQQLLIFMGGVALIAGIGFGIVGDARKNAPVKESERDHIGTATKRLPRERTKQHRRARARQARAARKRNR